MSDEKENFNYALVSLQLWMRTCVFYCRNSKTNQYLQLQMCSFERFSAGRSQGDTNSL